MSDLYNELFTSSFFMAPIFAFLIGAAGSLHCVGMCGGLVLSIAQTKKDVWQYNFGRLSGYLIMALLFSIFGAFLSSPDNKQIFAFIGSAVLGAYLIIAGTQALRGRELVVSIPLVQKGYSSLFKTFSGSLKWRAFGMGTCSILLPCALSNGFVLAALSLGSLAQAVLIVLFFWLGTLPAMVLGPGFVKGLSLKIGNRSQTILGVIFIIAGLLAIGQKVNHAISTDLFCL